MAGMIKPVSTILMAAVLIAVAIVPRGEAATCTEVEKQLQECVPYCMGKGPIGKCCDGVKALVSSLKTPAEKQGVCHCLQNMGKNQKGIDTKKVDGLPKECGVDAPYIAVGTGTDCSKIK